ncbi:MAG: hypothetical protein ACRED9_10870 [Caulobacteraceae bacterium]
MIASLSYCALGVHARRILDFLMVEHVAHGGRENGRLAATYRQLERFGLTKADIRKGLAELELTGFVNITEQGWRQAGGGAPSRYALTWLPTMIGAPDDAEPATDAWKGVLTKMARDGVKDVRSARRWLKAALDRPSRAGRRLPSAGNIEGAPQSRSDTRFQVRGENAGNVVPLAPQVRPAAVRK